MNHSTCAIEGGRRSQQSQPEEIPREREREREREEGRGDALRQVLVDVRGHEVRPINVPPVEVSREAASRVPVAARQGQRSRIRIADMPVPGFREPGPGNERQRQREEERAGPN